MQALWPWLAVAAAGALHGLHPASGWALAAWPARGEAAWRALLPIGLGHLASILTVALAVPATLSLGVAFEPLLAQGAAAVVLLVVLVRHWRARLRGRASPHARRTGLGLWCFMAGTAHGAGWMLVPALAPLCVGGAPGREITASGSLLLCMAAVAVHQASMLAATAVMAVAARQGVRAVRAGIGAARCGPDVSPAGLARVRAPGP